MNFATPLPIDAVLDEVRAALAARVSAVLVAPPGAGKTTRVPLALLDEGWLRDRKILVLEPRRIAARAAAKRMAQSLSESVGQRIGLRARTVSKSGPKTRIEVRHRGRLQPHDPRRSRAVRRRRGAVRRVHERSLDADLGLALALDCQRGLRDDLRIMAMSATLDGARVAQLLGDASGHHQRGPRLPGRDALSRPRCQCAHRGSDRRRGDAGLAG
jgi:ATP-dependent helicase HrpB